MSRLPDPLRRVRRTVTTAAFAVGAQYGSLRLLRDRRVAVLAVANVLDTMSATVFVPLLPTLAEDLGASPVVVGLIFAAPAVVGAACEAPAGYLSDRVGRRPLVSTGVTLSALPVAAIAFAWSPLALVALRSVDALLRALVGPATTAYLGDAYAPEERGEAFGAYHTSSMIGAAAGPTLGGAIAELGGIRAPFLVLGAGTFVGGLVLLAFLPPVDGGPSADGQGAPGVLPELSRESVGAFLSAPAAAWLATAFVDEFGSTALHPTFPLLLAETVGRGPAYVGATYSALAVATLVFLPIGGRFADRVGRVRVLIAASVGWSVVTVGLAVATSPLVPPALLFLGGILSAFAAPASFALRYELAPDGREATFSGVTGAVESLGKAAGPLFAGAVMGLWGVRAAVVAAGVSWLVAIPLLALLVPEEADGGV